MSARGAGRQRHIHAGVHDDFDPARIWALERPVDQFVKLARREILFADLNPIRTRREIARHSRLDAEAYDEYGRAMVDMARFVKPILDMTPPDPTSPGPRDLMKLLVMGRRFRVCAAPAPRSSASCPSAPTTPSTSR